jgi:cyclin B
LKENKKLTLYNKPKSSRNQINLNLNLSLSNNLEKNINKNKSNKTSKTICIFHIQKIPRNKSDENANNANIIKDNIPYYSYLNFNYINKEEEVSDAGEYLEEIYINLLIQERQSDIKPKIGYMNMQKEINEQMRAILIDWIIEVHFQFNLRQETLYMTIWIIDTYLSFHFISRKKLQLLGISCLLISCKSEEIYFPHQNKFIEVTDWAYTKEEMLIMENEILKKLNFNIVFPTSNDFYNILSKLYNFNKKQYYLGKYLIESVLIDYNMIKYSASIISAACIYLVMKYFGINGYQKLYNKYIINQNNPENVIKEAAQEICLLVENLSKSKLTTVKNKYRLNQFENVSEIL